MLLQLRRLLRWISGFAIAVLFGAAPLFAGTITVTSAGDSGAGTLGQAILDAAPDDTINFSLPPGTTAITLTSDQSLINKNLTITGPGANLLSVVRGRATGKPFFKFRILEIDAGTVTISGFTIANGNAFTGGTGSPTSTKKMKTKIMTTPHLGNSIGRSLPPITYHYPATPKPREGGSLPCHAVALAKAGHSLLILIALALCCFALSPAPKAFGVLPSPTPDGGYPGNNTAEGQNALQSLTSGTNNAAIGFRALFKDTTGGNNTATGAQTLYSNTTGNANTANGYVALTSNTTGGSNTATGSGALHANTTASHNTATGYISLYNTTTGSFNVADGGRALYTNSTGTQNVATGYQALGLNTTGSENTAAGYQALSSNTTGAQNTANGALALFSNTMAGDNTAVGSGALFSNTNGVGNTANGWNALDRNTTGSFNIALGGLAGNLLTTGNYNIDIGNGGVAGESGTIRIGDQDHGATYIAGISGQTASGGVAVYVNADGKLGTATSSARFKDEIKPMDKASEAILALKPVTFRYKKEIDSKGIPQFGLVAEEVEKVNPDLVARDRDGKPYTVRYDAVNAMLLNEFLKEHRKVGEQQATIGRLGTTAAKQEGTITRLESAVQRQELIASAQQKQIQTLTAQLKEQASEIQKVSAQLVAASPSRGGLEVDKPAPQMVSNNR